MCAARAAASGIGNLEREGNAARIVPAEGDIIVNARHTPARNKEIL